MCICHGHSRRPRGSLATGSWAGKNEQGKGDQDLEDGVGKGLDCREERLELDPGGCRLLKSKKRKSESCEVSDPPCRMFPFSHAAVLHSR